MECASIFLEPFSAVVLMEPMGILLQKEVA